MVSSIVGRIQEVVGKEHPVDLHVPFFNEKDIEYVTACVRSGWVSSVGEYVNRFESEIAAYTQSKHAVAVCNGTAALHICLKLAGVEPGDEVFAPSFTFVATANAIAYCQATPHFVDISSKDFGVDAQALQTHIETTCEEKGGILFNRRTGRRIRALVVMHTFGNPSDIENLRSLCSRYHLNFVEDAAESLGSTYRGKHTGTFGQTAAISFNGNKIITTGGGGMILTQDESIAKHAKHLTTTAKRPHPWSFDHDEVGYNYRLPNLNASLGCAQLTRLDDNLKRKRALAAKYHEIFSDEAYGVTLKESENCQSNYWLNTLILNKPQWRDDVLRDCHAQGIKARPAWTPLHQLEPFKSSPRADLSVTEDLFRRVISLPSSPQLYK